MNSYSKGHSYIIWSELLLDLTDGNQIYIFISWAILAQKKLEQSLQVLQDYADVLAF